MAPGPHLLFPGCASVTFDQPIFLKTHGEQVLYVNVEGKGIVTITGCCHPGVLGLLDYAKENFEGFAAFHGVYGGLHIAPFEEWGPRRTSCSTSCRGSTSGSSPATIARARSRRGRCGSAACP